MKSTAKRLMALLLALLVLSAVAASALAEGEGFRPEPKFSVSVSGNTTGTSRAYYLDVLDAGGYTLASSYRQIDYETAYNLTTAGSSPTSPT